MTSRACSSGSPRRKRVRFERHPSRVVFDPSSSQFVVTWSRCDMPPEDRISAKKDVMSWIPSVSAVAALYDRGCIPREQTVYAAMAIGRAWAAGDRTDLDTDGAKKAAELVHDLSVMCVDATSPSVAIDVGQAMRHLLDEIAAVRLAFVRPKDLDAGTVIPPLEKAARECLAVDGFVSWPKYSMRRRFLFCLNRRERSPVAYTIASLIFDSGSCPLLSLSDRRAVRIMASRESGMYYGLSEERMSAFMRYALSAISRIKDRGPGVRIVEMTQNQLADSVADSSASEPTG